MSPYDTGTASIITKGVAKDRKPTRADTILSLGLTPEDGPYGVTDAEWAEAMSKRSNELSRRNQLDAKGKRKAERKTARDMLIVEIESYPADTTEEQDMLDNIVLNLRASR